MLNEVKHLAGLSSALLRDPLVVIVSSMRFFPTVRMTRCCDEILPYGQNDKVAFVMVNVVIALFIGNNVMLNEVTLPRCGSAEQIRVLR
jgi:hypothetical protein